MQIRQATLDDADGISSLYLQAFDSAEAGLVADLAVRLLSEHTDIEIISLVAVEGDDIAGHVAFSPVLLEATGEHIGYILAPLAVLPKYQKNKIGSSLVQSGLDAIASTAANVVFVYGDPQYYSRFGFQTKLADSFMAPYPLQYPHGWQVLILNNNGFPAGGKITCVASLHKPQLW